MKIRLLVLLLAILAGIKVWTQERLYREGAQDALILAYRDRAIAACQMSAPDSSVGHRPASPASLPLWTRPASVAVVSGRSNAEVSIWEVNSALWPARFKHPHVVLTASDRLPYAVCEYDVIEGRAYLTQL